MRKSRSLRRNGQRGGAAVEFAIVLPLFCGILFGIIDYGWYFFQKFSLAAGVRDCVRYGVTFSYSSGLAATRAEGRKTTAFTGSAVNYNDVTVTGVVTGGPPDATLSVTATYTFKPLAGLVRLPTPAMTYRMTMLLEQQN